MSQALASLPRNLVILLALSLLAACNGSYGIFDSDRKVDNDPKTANIKRETAELMSLSAVQSAFFGHSQSLAYEFLDASDLPLDAVLVSDGTFERPCLGGGSIVYSYSRNSGEQHKKGDRISVTYDHCIENGAVYAGSIKGRYTKINGLNNRFVDLNTDQCLERVQDDLGLKESAKSIIKYDAQEEQYILNGNEIAYKGGEFQLTNKTSVYLPGDELKFERVGSNLKVDLLSVSIADNSNEQLIDKEKIATVELSFYIEPDQKVIFILQPPTASPNMLTSIDGDQIYTIKNLQKDKQECQNFERILDVSLKNFSTNKEGFLKTELNGSVKLVDAKEGLTRINQAFRDSDFKTTVVQGNDTQVYKMKDYNVEKAIDIADNTYAYGFQGFVQNDEVLDGKIELTTLGKFYGSFERDFPAGGVFELKGKGLERINIEPDNLSVLLRIDYNGDSTGNGFADVDTEIKLDWTDLFNRNFVE